MKISRAIRALPSVMCFLMSAAGVSAVHAYELQDTKAPVLRICPMTTAPVIDGVLSPNEWAGAAQINTFHPLTSVTTPMNDITAYIGYDAKNIYVAACIPLHGGRAPIALKRERDGDVWADDAVEFFLDPLHNNRTEYQFNCNAVGSISDTKDKDPKWNGQWSAKTSVGKNCWYLEMAIPLSTVGLTSLTKPAVVGFNIGIDVKQPNANFTWAPLLDIGGYHQPEKFAHLILDDQTGCLAALQTSTAKSLSFDVSTVKAADAELVVTPAGLAPSTITANCQGLTSLLAPVSASTDGPSDYSWLLTLRDKQSSEVLLRQSGQYISRNSAKLSLRRYDLYNKLGVDVQVPALSTTDIQANVAVTVKDRNGAVLSSANKVSTTAATSFLFDITKYPYDKVTITAEVTNSDGMHAVTSTDMMREKKPEWVGSKAGITDKVLAPWTPIKLQKSAKAIDISLWGRKYSFAGSPFPASVVTNNASILNGPITMRMLVDGKPKVLSGTLKLVKQTPSQVILDGNASVGSLTAKSHIVMDYDGNALIDVTLYGKQTATIDQFSIDIPIKKQYAKLRHYFPTPAYCTENSRAIPAEGWGHTFVSFLWVGDEDRGIALYTTSDENWAWAKDAQAATIKPTNAKTTTMSFNMVTRPLTLSAAKLSKGVAYRFGLQATPVKKPDKDVWDYRICHSGEYGIENDTVTNNATISYDASNLLDLSQGTLDLWVRPNFDPNVVVKDGEDRGKYNRYLLTISNGQDQLVFYWNIDVRGMRVYLFSRGQFTMLGDVPCKWNKEELHQLSLAWGNAIKVSIDGGLPSSTSFLGLMNGAAPASSMQLQVNNPGFDIEAVKLSKTSMPGQSYGKELTPDDNTVLLDKFTDIVTMGPSRAETKPAVGVRGEITGGYKLSGGQVGKLVSTESSSQPMLDYLWNAGYRTIVFHEHWTDVQNWPEAIGHEEQLRNFVKVCHAKGFQVLVYFGYEISNIMPGWIENKDSVMVKPDWQSYTRAPQQKDYVVCYESVWQDFIADGVSKMIDKYDIDGVYLDSTALPFPCSNTVHGCGYTRDDGTLAPTFDYRGPREMMRRLYTVVKSKKPNGQVNLHNSGYEVTPAVGWATSSWDGEHLTPLTKRQPIDELIPLDAFRAEFMGRQFGIPSEFLCYDLPYTFHESFTLTLLHDVLVRARGYAMNEEIRVFKAMDAFGRKQAQFQPYWSNGSLVSVKGSKAYCSLYVRKNQGVMCVVSSFAKGKQDVAVKLNLQAMGLTKATTATNMMTGEKLKLQNGQFTLTTNDTDYGLIWVK